MDRPDFEPSLKKLQAAILQSSKSREVSIFPTKTIFIIEIAGVIHCISRISIITTTAYLDNYQGILS